MTDKPFIVGITGSIGTGKTTTSEMFRDEGVPVWDADLAVHRLYAKGGKAVPAIEAIKPEAVIDGVVDRTVLSAWLMEDPTALKQIEAAVHPILAADRNAFLAEATADIVGLDMPLLFETNVDALTDAVVVISIDPEEQRRRVMERPGMVHEKFETILKRQMPDAQKRAKADFVIESKSMESAREDVRSIIADIRKRLADA